MLCIVIGSFVLPYVVAILMPSKKWFIWYCIIWGGLLTYVCVDYHIDSSKPHYHGTPGDILVVIILHFASYSTIFGIATKLTHFLLAKKQCSKNIADIPYYIGFVIMLIFTLYN